MASVRPLLFLYISILLVLCLIKFTPIPQYMVSPEQANTILLLNLSFYSSKRYNEGVVPAFGVAQNFNREIWPSDGELISEQEMVALTEKNFTNFITQNQHVMVVFYSSKYFWRKRLSPQSSAAAMKRKGKLVIAKVDAEKEKLLAKKYKIENYPSIYFFYYGFIEEFYDDQPIWIPAETGKTEKIKLTKCDENEEHTNFDASLKEIQEPIRSDPVEDVAPTRSNEKIIWKVEYPQPGVASMYPVRTSGRSTEIALDTTSEVERETNFLNRPKQLNEPVKSYKRLRETGKSTLTQNEVGTISIDVGESEEDDENLKSSTDNKIKSGSTSLSWIPLETENGATEEKSEEPANKIIGNSYEFQSDLASLVES